MKNVVRVVIYTKHGIYYAQCLEYDIMASSERYEDLKDYIYEAMLIDMQLTKQRYGEIFAKIKPAPDEFFKMWDSVATKVQSESPWKGLWRRIKTSSFGQKTTDIQYPQMPFKVEMGELLA